EAVSFAERGASLDGDELSDSSEHALIYSRVMARARRPEAILPLIEANPSIGQRIANAAGKIIADTYTPDEKQRLAELLASRPAPEHQSQAEFALLAFVQSAGLFDVEARWRVAAMTAQAKQIDTGLASLETHRGHYAEWGRELESYAAAHRG